MSRIVITSCSSSKNHDPNLLPAIERYDGPTFRLLRRYLSQPANDINIFVLSAKFGFVSHETRLPFYEQKLDKFHVDNLGTLVSRQALTLLAEHPSSKEIFINLGKTYFDAFQPTLDRISIDTSLTVASGSSGKRLSELHNWLYGSQSRLLIDAESSFKAQEIQFRGRTIRKGEVDIRSLIRKSVANGEAEQIQNFQSWFVLVDGIKVSPKWLVSRLTGLPVGVFHSDQARKVLQKLGIEVQRV